MHKTIKNLFLSWQYDIEKTLLIDLGKTQSGSALLNHKELNYKTIYKLLRM